MAQEPKPQAKEAEMHSDSGDVESGRGDDLLYPKMTEDPALRWAFIRKVYAILSVQFLFTAAVATVGLFLKPIPDFLLTRTPAAWAVYLVVLLSPLVGAFVNLSLY
jgi:protein lifeguard